MCHSLATMIALSSQQLSDAALTLLKARCACNNCLQVLENLPQLRKLALDLPINFLTVGNCKAQELRQEIYGKRGCRVCIERSMLVELPEQELQMLLHMVPCMGSGMPATSRVALCKLLQQQLQSVIHTFQVTILPKLLKQLLQ